MKHLLISLLVVVICMMTSTALRGQNKDPVKSWQQLGENDSLVISLLPINSVRDDYAPLFIDGVLYFTSNRYDRHTDEAALRYNESIYASRYQDSVWSKPKKFYFFNSDDYTALAGISSCRTQLFTYKTFGGGDLYRSSLNEKGKWLRPKRMKSPINSSYHEQSATEANGIMVISSDRPGGLGQHDLYWSITDDDGQYRTFVPFFMANTNGDEVDVSFSTDGKTLYFSSDVGGKGGGYSIFCMHIDNEKQWSTPQELFLSSFGNIRWFFDADSMFFCVRQNEQGYDDLWWGHVIPKIKEDTLPILQDTTLLVQDTLLIDTLLIQQFVHLNERPTEQVFFTPDGAPDTIRQEKLLTIYDKLDSLQFQVYTAQVQIGAYYYLHSVDEFRYNYPAFDTTNIYIEKIQTQRGILYKYLIDTTYSNLQEGAVRQQEALLQQTNQHNRYKIKQGDAFIVVFNKEGERIIIYFNVEKMNYKIIKGNTVIYF